MLGRCGLRSNSKRAGDSDVRVLIIAASLPASVSLSGAAGPGRPGRVLRVRVNGQCGGRDSPAGRLGPRAEAAAAVAGPGETFPLRKS
jgi:hypothetical protein